LLLRRQVVAHLVHEDQQHETHRVLPAPDQRIGEHRQQHGAAGEQYLAELEAAEQQQQELDHLTLPPGGGGTRAVFLPFMYFLKPATAPNPAPAISFQIWMKNAAASANRPSFLSATPPISAARPYSATLSVEELKSW